MARAHDSEYQGENAERMEGRVVRLMADKGFGFLRDSQGKEWFFHRSGTREWDQITLNQKLTFTPTNTPKGPRAEDVELEG